MKKANKWPFLHFYRVNAVLNFSSFVFFWNVKDHKNESGWIRLYSPQTQHWCCSSVWIQENYFHLFHIFSWSPCSIPAPHFHDLILFILTNVITFLLLFSLSFLCFHASTMRKLICLVINGAPFSEINQDNPERP